MEPESAPRPRDPVIDNGKGALIILVVLGHFLETAGGWHDPVLGAVLTAIYAFHMPAFVFLAGLTSRAGAAGVVVPALLLVVFQLAYVGPRALVSGNLDPLLLVKPYWILWFLASLIAWRLLIPVFARLRWPLLWAVAAALLAGFLPWDGRIFSLSRTLVFLPFFVAGQLYGRRVLALLGGLRVPAAGWAAILGAVLAGIVQSGVSRQWFYGAVTYADLGAPADGVPVRGALMLAAAAATAALLALMPRRETVLSRCGAGSLGIYLVHGFFVIAAWPLNHGLLHHHGWAACLASTGVMTAGCVALLSLPVIDRTLRALASRAADRFSGRRAPRTG
jgi:fucose 4-O-acetylase-like acetyltransferase